MLVDRHGSAALADADPEAARGALRYLRLLQTHGLSPTERGVWAAVGRSSRTQGWKLHLSSVPVEAVALLDLVVPFLKSCDVSFKVAKDEMVLCQLNEGELGGTQMGKFITIYPESDDHAAAIARRLVEMTEGFHGPVVVTDLRLGAVVYTRYGNYNPIVLRDRLGQILLFIEAPDGALRLDSYSVPFVCPDEIPNPFVHMSYVGDEAISAEGSLSTDGHGSAATGGSKLLGPGYLVLDALKYQAKGSVFRGIDLRSQELVSAKVIKQGRRHCLSDSYGRDMRDRLQRQQRLHAALSSHPSIPKADPYFEWGGDGYLPIEFVAGESIESLAVRSLAGRSWRYLPAEQQLRLLEYLERLIGAVERLHADGYVHRDLTASNVWIGEDEQVYLIDLELCHAVGDPDPPFGLGTPGFMSPEQASRQAPAYTDDIYAIGCVMTLLVSGMDPRRILFPDSRSRTSKLQALTGAPLSLIETIDECLHADPRDRPRLEEIHSAVQTCIRDLTKRRDRAAVPPDTERESGRFDARARDLIRDGERGLHERSIVEPTTGLWLSAAFRNTSHQAGTEYATAYELRRSANRGIAGVVYLLGRLARSGYGTDAARQRVHAAVEWLLSGESAPDSGLPGLHFGDAGVAVALSEAVAGGLIAEAPRVKSFIKEALSGDVDWPDITHGAAGQGVASLYCGDALQDESLRDFSHRYAGYLIETQSPDGSWQMPPGVDGMSGQTLTGFAHGTGGIVYFLSSYAHRFGTSAARATADAGARWLMRQAIPSEDGTSLEWAYSDTNPARWKWWCHGSPGIALTFMKLYEHTECVDYAEIADRALRVHPIDLRYGNLSQCHGLSGLGEIYLEARQVLGGSEWAERAENVARVLAALSREQDGAASWLAEDPHQPTADLMVGSSGVIHFLLRYSLPPGELGFPLLQ